MDSSSFDPIAKAAASFKTSNFSSKFSSIELLDSLSNIKGPFSSFDLLSSYPTDKAIALEKQVAELRSTVKKHLERVNGLSQDKEAQAREIQELNKALDTLERKKELDFLLKSVTPKAHEIILSEVGDLRGNFFSQQVTKAFVVSADIRRSTELMLKAQGPAEFAAFMTTLWGKLEEIFKNNYGVVDKFTGDGILAFFPEFFSGKHAGYYALRASFQAQEAFDHIYKESRSSFKCVQKDSGIGTGIDYGDVHLKNMGGGLTVVGQPVVYACRFGGAPAGHTYLNQSAYDKIADMFGQIFQLSEAEIEVKHEGTLLCYDASLRPSDFQPDLPSWCNSAENTSAPIEAKT